MSLLENLKDATNYTFTENGAVTHQSTRSKLLDMFALGGAYRSRSDEDRIHLFADAYEENPEFALKCLFYLRDIRGGQGERKFFRTCYRWLSFTHSDVARRLLPQIPEYGRWDDLYYCTWNTAVMDDALDLIKKQLMLDMTCKTPSLLAKWVKSENASSKETRMYAEATRRHLGLTHKQYRQMLTKLRNKINIVETLMSQNRWDEIEFDKLPSKAGLIYKNAFARRDILKEKYRTFAKSKDTKVNARTLYPYECVKEAIKLAKHANLWERIDSTDRLMVNKYWENLTDYFNKANFNALAVVDTSGSMTWSNVGGGATPMDVAISLGLYCAEKAKGPFANHYISFASVPQLIDTNGGDFIDKVSRIYQTNLCDNTNIEGVFDLLLDTMIQNNAPQSDLPDYILIMSDMEFDSAAYSAPWGRCYVRYTSFNQDNAETLLEEINKRWESAGYQMPKLIFWNLDARQKNIPIIGNGRISYVSGFSPSIFQTIISGKSGYELMMEILCQPRYASIY